MCSVQLVNVINKACLFQDKEYECATVCLNKTKTEQCHFTHNASDAPWESTCAKLRNKGDPDTVCQCQLHPSCHMLRDDPMCAQRCIWNESHLHTMTYSWWDMYVKCGINNSEQCEKTCWLMIAVLFPVTLMLYCSCLTAWRGNWYVMCTLPYICIHS